MIQVIVVLHRIACGRIALAEVHTKKAQGLAARIDTAVRLADARYITQLEGTDCQFALGAALTIDTQRRQAGQPAESDPLVKPGLNGLYIGEAVRTLRADGLDKCDCFLQGGSWL
ncbi:hypothetical protein EEB15_02805 [Ramlibacter sp. WS9]|nr:hypothetical protein EEB15_02805 [Ramlibacter sp. WS9]